MRSLVLDLHELLSSHVYVMVHLALVPSSVVLVVYICICEDGMHCEQISVGEDKARACSRLTVRCALRQCFFAPSPMGHVEWYARTLLT